MAKAKEKGFVQSFMERVKTSDAWSNVITGLGLKSRDARLATDVHWRRMSERDIEEMYAGDAMASKIVDLPVDEALEKGYELTGLDHVQHEHIKNRAAELHFDTAISDGARKARLYGGSGILKVYDDDLRIETRVKRSGKKRPPLKSLVVFQRFELYSTWEDVNKDILSPDFNTPYRYTFFGRHTDAGAANIKIHYDRIVRFEGSWLPDSLRQANGYWSDTILSKLYDSIRNYAFAHDSVSAALKDFSTAVFKIKDLADQMTAGDCDEKIITRLQQIDMTKSIVRAVVVDADGEDFEYKTRNMTGVADLVKSAESRLSAETGMPHTILLGNSPTGGLGATGNHEETNWNKWVSSFQQAKLKPQMLEILREIAEELGYDSSKLDIVFNPLSEETEKEKIENRNKQALTDAIYLDQGVIDASEVRTSRFGGDTYSSETEIDLSIDPAELKPEPAPYRGGF